MSETNKNRILFPSDQFRRFSKRYPQIYRDQHFNRRDQQGHGTEK